MSQWLRQSTAVEIPLGPFVDATDGDTAEASLTLSQADVRLKKNGGAWGQKAETSSATYEENGWYEVALDTTDTNTLGRMTVAIFEAGALKVWDKFMVVPANVYDSLFLGTDNLEVDTTLVRGYDASKMLGQATYGVAQGGSSTTIQLAAATLLTDDALRGGQVMIVAGTGLGQAARYITGYVNSTDTATVSPAWNTSPDSTSVYAVFGTAPVATTDPLATGIADIQARIPAALTANGHMKSDVLRVIGKNLGTGGTGNQSIGEV